MSNENEKAPAPSPPPSPSPSFVLTKGINGLDKVLLRESRGSSAEVRFHHRFDSHYGYRYFWLMLWFSGFVILLDLDLARSSFWFWFSWNFVRFLVICRCTCTAVRWLLGRTTMARNCFFSVARCVVSSLCALIWFQFHLYAVKIEGETRNTSCIFRSAKAWFANCYQCIEWLEEVTFGF